MALKPSTIKRRIKREYRKSLDRMIRSHAFHKFAIRLLYLAGFVISVFLAALIYFQK